MRTCKKCGRELPEDAVVCPYCSKGKDSALNRIAINDGDEVDREYQEQHETCSRCGRKLVTDWEKEHGICVYCNNGYLPKNERTSSRKRSSPLNLILGAMFLIISFICFKYSLSLLYDNEYSSEDTNTTFKNSTVNNSRKTTTVESTRKPKDDELFMELGASSDSIKEKLKGVSVSKQNYTTLVDTKSDKPGSFQVMRTKDDSMGNCLDVLFDDITFHGYQVSSIFYNFLHPIYNNSIITSSDYLTAVVIDLNVIDKCATYNDLVKVYTKKYGECAETIKENDWNAYIDKSAHWRFTDGSNILIECGYMPVKEEGYTYIENVTIYYYSDEHSEKLTELIKIREAEALESENAIRENR